MLNEFINHWDHYGHDKEKNYKGKWLDKEYKTFVTAEKDTFVQAALYNLDDEDFITLMEHCFPALVPEVTAKLELLKEPGDGP